MSLPKITPWSPPVTNGCATIPRDDVARVRATIAEMMDRAHSELPLHERDHLSGILTTKVMAEALPGSVEEIMAVHPIGRHSICEFRWRRGARSQTAFAALEAL